MTRVRISTAAALTLTTDVVMVYGMVGVYEAAEAIVGYPVYTHELRIAADKAREAIPALYPGFPVEATSENWRAVLRETVARFGETIEIERGTDVRTADPATTLAQAVRKARS